MVPKCGTKRLGSFSASHTFMLRSKVPQFFVPPPSLCLWHCSVSSFAGASFLPICFSSGQEYSIMTVMLSRCLSLELWNLKSTVIGSSKQRLPSVFVCLSTYIHRAGDGLWLYTHICLLSVCVYGTCFSRCRSVYTHRCKLSGRNSAIWRTEMHCCNDERMQRGTDM